MKSYAHFEVELSDYRRTFGAPVAANEVHPQHLLRCARTSWLIAAFQDPYVWCARTNYVPSKIVKTRAQLNSRDDYYSSYVLFLRL